MNLKFTNTCNKKEVVFLDVIISKSDGRLITKTHYKPTAKNNLLPFSSFHPRPLKENLPYGLYLRIRRNCSNLNDFRKQSGDLTTRLKNRGYPDRVLNKGFKRARNQPREVLVEDNPRVDKAIPLTCVTTYSVASNTVKKAINKHWRILTSNKRTWEKPLFSFKKGRSLRDCLVHTRPINRPITNTPSVTDAWGLPNVVGHFPCANCCVCHLTTHTKVLDLEPGKNWTQRTLTNCNSTDVVYLITCPCGLRYVGMTTRKVKQRICEHRSNIRCRKVTTRLSEHFLEKNHTTNDLRWTIIEQVKVG